MKPSKNQPSENSSAENSQHSDDVLATASLSSPSSLPKQADPFVTVDLPSSQGDSTERETTTVSCPSCHNRFPAEVTDSDSISCPSCGHSYQICKDLETTCSEAGGQKLGKFALIRELGKGAFGLVFLATDTELQRKVAIKLPRTGTFANADEEERFLREARHAARLRHPGLVPVYEVGRTEQGPYIASEFVEGVTLADHQTGTRFTFPESAMLVVELAEALQEAHHQGVIHRDLKPSNIMLEPADASARSSQSHGSSAKRSADSRDSRLRSLPKLTVRPRILDFGLARRDEAEQIAITMEGQLVGTPAYMSPEQARGEGNRADRRCDLYSLGVILFELLTGERPFRGNARMVIQQTMSDDPPKPRKLNGLIPRDLETICLKCLEKDPAKRYQDAQSLADDLYRFLQDIPIRARPVSRTEHVWRWCKRHPDLVASVGTLSGLIVIVTAVAFAMITVSRNAQQRARIEAEGLASENEKLFHQEQAARKETEASRQMARGAVDNYLIGLSDSLQYFPGMGNARHQLLEEAVADYEQFTKQQSDDPSLEVERGRALQKLGDARLALGEVEQGVAAYREAEEILTAQLDRVEDNTECQLEVARTQMKLGLALSEQLKSPPTEALDEEENRDAVDQYYRQAIARLQNILAESPKHLEAEEILLASILNRGLFLSYQNRVEEASRLFAFVEQRASQTLLSNSSFELLSTMIAARTASGHLLTRQGKLSPAVAKLQAAVASCNELVSVHPDKFDAVNQRAVTHVLLAKLYRQLGALPQELATYGNAMEDYSTLLALLPDSPVFRENMALTRTDYGQALVESVRHAEAEQEFTLALETLLQLLEEAPQVTRYYVEAATCQDMLADLYLDHGQVAEAMVACDQSIAVLEHLALTFPERPDYRERLAIAQTRMGRILLRQDRVAEGKALLETAIGSLQSLAAESGELASYQFALALAHSHYAEALAPHEKPSEVKRILGLAAGHWQQLADESEVPRHLYQAAWFFLTTADNSLVDAKLARAYLERAMAHSPENADYQAALGIAAYVQGDWPACCEAIEKSIKTRADVHGRDLFFLARAQHQLEQKEQAQKTYAQANTWLEANYPGRLDFQRLAQTTAELIEAEPVEELGAEE